MAKSCFFIGHAELGREIFTKLYAEIERAITENNVTEFYVGKHGGFDAVVYHALREAKKEYSEIQIYLVAVYHPGERIIEMPEGMDGIVYPLQMSVPPRYALPRGNRAMIDQCDVLIAAVSHPGNARELLEYARKREKRGRILTRNIINSDI